MSFMQLVALSVMPALESPCIALPVLTVLITFELQAFNNIAVITIKTIFIDNSCCSLVPISQKSACRIHLRQRQYRPLSF